jgi:thiamine-monophosphate kinase
MAATPIAMLVAMSIPADWKASVGDIAEGIGEASRAFDAPITGGNLTSGKELALTVTVLGHAVRPLQRDTVVAGDMLYVTGALGGPRCAIEAWDVGLTPRPEHRARFIRPTARIAEAKWLAAHGAVAAIDVSDGLIADLRHLAAASGVDICVELDAIPTITGAKLQDAAQSGEEYEIVVATHHAFDEHAFAREFGVPLTRIGVATGALNRSPDVRLRSHGKFVDLPAGHDHFSR